LIYIKLQRVFQSEEKFGITSQIRRASTSIPINIAEGAARRSQKEFTHFSYISLGSLSEVDTLLLLCIELEYIDKVIADKHLADLDHIGKLITGLIRKLNPKE